MGARKTEFRQVKASLEDLVGRAYVSAAAAGRAALTGESARALTAAARRKVDFYPRAMQRRLVALLPRVGRVMTAGLRRSARGAASASFAAAAQTAQAPLSTFGTYRLGEDGKLYLTTKSEHYHVPLGHGFPGHELLATARRLGVSNPTHNNTRGHITRLLEEHLVRLAAGAGQPALSRVINLQSGSLVVEAAIKMVLARFYQPQDSSPKPPHAGKTPVLLVLGDDEGKPLGNYHGTTITAQMMRGMWPQLYQQSRRGGAFEVHAVRPNCIEDLDAAFRKFHAGPRRIAGFFHELVMMNYGGRLLSKAFLRRAYDLCRKHDVPTVVDEIQSVLWSPRIYMFREYGLRPSAVALGKGMPNGEYAAARILFSSQIDNLPQFGALVTNGQEDLASLAYLVSLRWAEANADVTEAVGEYYERRLRQWADEHRGLIASIEGRRHLLGIHFADLVRARAFTAALVGLGVDISVQTYKAHCPPAALTKLPLIAGYETVDTILQRLDAAVRLL